ncbi:MAG: hypothetical protein AAGH90_07580 [Pseudomonadota bacterium]
MANIESYRLQAPALFRNLNPQTVILPLSVSVKIIGRTLAAKDTSIETRMPECAD